MKFSTFVLLMAVLVVVLAFDTNGNAGDSAPVPVAEPVQASPIIKRIRQRSVTVEAGKVERDLSVCGPNGCRTVTRSSVVESAPVRSRGKLLSRLRNRRSRSVSVSRSLGCSK
jgi:hypothetical protein